jgi:hypothetical protein
LWLHRFIHRLTLAQQSALNSMGPALATLLGSTPLLPNYNIRAATGWSFMMVTMVIITKAEGEPASPANFDLLHRLPADADELVAHALAAHGATATEPGPFLERARQIAAEAQESARRQPLQVILVSNRCFGVKPYSYNKPPTARATCGFSSFSTVPACAMDPQGPPKVCPFRAGMSIQSNAE